MMSYTFSYTQGEVEGGQEGGRGGLYSMFYYTSFNMALSAWLVCHISDNIYHRYNSVARHILSNPVIRVKPHLLFRPESL